MEDLFLHLLNLSITASYIVLAVILLRLLLFKAPKWINCLLWAVVAIRLILPFSIESILSLIPSAEPIPQDIMLSPTPQINTGIEVFNSAVNPIIEQIYTPDSATSANPLQISFAIWSCVWLIGIAAMLIWSAISYLRLRKRTAPSILLRDNVYFCDAIDTPFILGIFRPRIYLPSEIAEESIPHVVAHEQTHIARKDHLLKPFAYLLLSVYWFNPLLWVSYILFCRDVEMACDERVIKTMPPEGRQGYSSALLSCSIRRSTISSCPLAFGEVGVKSRIKSVLNYKKPSFWIIILSLLLCVVLAIGFLTVPKKDRGETDPENLTGAQLSLMEVYPEYFGLDKSKGLDVYVWQFAENHYGFGLLPHAERNWLSEELLNLRGVPATTMREILKTYNVSEDDVNIVPWQNPLSSYLGDYWIVIEGEDPTEKREAYIEKIREMLFGTQIVSYSLPVYDSTRFDVDGDGRLEICTLKMGMTSGAFTFIFTAQEEDAESPEYQSRFYSDWYDLSFFKSESGWCVRGIDSSGVDHFFDISIVDGHINLSENGVPIGEITTIYQNDVFTEEIVTVIQHPFEQHVDFESKDLSSVDKMIITDGTNGAKAEITDPKQLAILIKVIKTIEGEEPISDRGYYGFHYNVVLYCGEETFFSFGLFSDVDRVYLTYGLYETVGGHDYCCRYILTNCSYEDIDNTFRAFFP